VQNDISDVLDLTFSMDADEEKLILYEKAEVPPPLPCACVCHGEPVGLSFLQAKSYDIFAGH
jgi:E3 ubiquitin-protein ligase HUWE1